MSYYEVLLFLHVVGAIIWVGSAFLMFVLFYRGKSTSDFGLVAGISGNTQWLAQRVFIPTTLVMLVLGILLTIEGPWTFGMLWIVLGFVGYVAIMVLGLGFIEPAGKRLSAVAAERGPTDPEVRWRSRRMDALGILDIVLLVVVVFDMTVKPTGEDVAALTVMAVATLAALGYTVKVYREPLPSAVEAAPQAQPAA